jgi:hypothetical protein
MTKAASRKEASTPGRPGSPWFRHSNLKWMLLLVIGLNACVGCSTFTPISSQDLKNQLEMERYRASGLSMGYFYMGSDEKWHYLVHRSDTTKTTYYKVAKGELRIEPERPLSHSLRSWTRVDPEALISPGAEADHLPRPLPDSKG